MHFKAKIGENVFVLDTEVEAEIVENAEATILDCKRALERIGATIKATEQKWVFQGKILNDATKLKDSGLKEDNCVIVIRSVTQAAATTTTQTPVAPLATTTTAPATAEPAPAPAPVYVPNPQFDQAMLSLFEHNTNPSVVEDAVSLLLKISGNVINNPYEEKYRRLSSTNAAFQKKVGSITGGNALMQGIGFQLQANGDWVLVPSEAAWNNLIQCAGKLDKFLNRLKSSKLATTAAPSTTTSSVPAPASAAPVPTNALLQLLQLLPTTAATATAATTTTNSNEDGERKPKAEETNDTTDKDKMDDK